MTEEATDAPSRVVGMSSRRLTRSAIEAHWNPSAIDLESDTNAVGALSRVEFTRLRGLLAQFGVSEQSVTEDLGPLTVTLENPADQRFVATQLYDEIRHAELFDRYWTTVVQPEERARGMPKSDSRDNRWHAEAHTELLDRTGDAMTMLIEQDTATTRARAYAHYHLTVEGILAQTAYEWIETRYGDQRKSIVEGDPAGKIPELPGLAEGIKQLRRDESRHVRFGVMKTRELLDGSVDPTVVCETVNELLPLVEETIGRMVQDDGTDGSRKALLGRVEEWSDRRLEQVGARETE